MRTVALAGATGTIRFGGLQHESLTGKLGTQGGPLSLTGSDGSASFALKSAVLAGLKAQGHEIAEVKVHGASGGRAEPPERLTTGCRHRPRLAPPSPARPPASLGPGRGAPPLWPPRLRGVNCPFRHGQRRPVLRNHQHKVRHSLGCAPSRLPSRAGRSGVIDPLGRLGDKGREELGVVVRLEAVRLVWKAKVRGHRWPQEQIQRKQTCASFDGKVTLDL